MRRVHLVAIPLIMIVAIVCSALSLPAAVIYVDSSADSTGDSPGCTLREALTAANLDADFQGCSGAGPYGYDTILFRGAVAGTVIVTADLPVITGNLELRGPGADSLTVEGQGAYRLFYIDGGETPITVGMSGLTIAGGLVNSGAFGGGGIHVHTSDTLELSYAVVSNCTAVGRGGGGIDNFLGSITLDHVTIRDNTATGGGGIDNTGGPAHLDSVTIDNNMVEHVGGGIKNSELSDDLTGEHFRGRLTMVNSTLSGNRSDWNGGGIYNYYSDIMMDHVTVTGNIADFNHDDQGAGGGIYDYQEFGRQNSITTRNSIIAGNYNRDVVYYPPPMPPVFIELVPDDCNTNLMSQGGNLIGTDLNCTVVGQQASDQVGTQAAPIDPGLNTLADNGGFTWTHALGGGSPAVDAAPGSALSVDQRGMKRHMDGDGLGGSESDSGAYEKNRLPGSEIALLTPTGDLRPARPYTIFFAPSDEKITVTLKLSHNRGRTWKKIGTVLEGDRYDWLVPKQPKNRYSRIKAISRDLDGARVSSPQIISFRILPVEIVSPAAGDRFTGGDDLLLRWRIHPTRTRPAKVVLKYSCTSPSRWRKIRAFKYAAESYSWTLFTPGNPRECKVLVTVKNRSGRILGITRSDIFTVDPSQPTH